MSSVSMGHDEVRSLLPDALNGTLTPELAENVRTHLDSCVACREAAQTIEAGLVLLKSEAARVAPVNYFSTVVPRVRQRIERRSSRWPVVNVLSGRFAAPLAALAVVVVMFARMAFNPAAQDASLRSVIGSLSSEELADALVRQAEGQLSPWSAEVLSSVVSENAVTNELAAAILESEEASSYQTVSDLSDKEVDQLLQRLRERSVL